MPTTLTTLQRRLSPQVGSCCGCGERWHARVKHLYCRHVPRWQVAGSTRSAGIHLCPLRYDSRPPPPCPMLASFLACH